MTSQPRFLIHPGYPKCASTSLQANVFAKHDGIRYLSYNSAPGDALRDRIENIEFHDRLRGHRPPDLARISEIWERYFLPATDRKRLNVLSEEKFLVNSRPLLEIARDLRRVVGEAHVLIVVREQAEILRSLYDMYPWVPDDRARRFVPFESWLTTLFERPQNSLVPALRFRSAIEGFADAFGGSAVLVISLSRLLRDRNAQLSLCERIRIDPKQFSELIAQPSMNTAGNHQYKKIVRRVLGTFRASQVLSSTQIAFIRDCLTRLIPEKKTRVSDSAKALIRSYYDDETIEALEGTGAECIL